MYAGSQNLMKSEGVVQIFLHGVSKQWSNLKPAPSWQTDTGFQFALHFETGVPMEARVQVPICYTFGNRSQHKIGRKFPAPVRFGNRRSPKLRCRFPFHPSTPFVWNDTWGSKSVLAVWKGPFGSLMRASYFSVKICSSPSQRWDSPAWPVEIGKIIVAWP